MIYRIYYQGVVKFATPVKNREELMALRNSKENLEHLAKARAGDQKEKGKLLQLAYNLGYAEGKLAGCESQGSFFFHDVDCYDQAKSAEIRDLILSKKDEIGLMMLEKSPGGGWHLVCRREPGTTILENQVKVAVALRLEMDTNAKNLNRVVFSTSGSEEDLPYLDDELFDEPMTAEECLEEFKRLKEREKRGLESVPKSAKKANKHYCPWEGLEVSGKRSEVSGQRSEVSGERSEVSGENKPQTSNLKSQTPPPRVDFIFRECMKEEGVTETDLTDEGGRHNSVKMVLSSCNQLLTKEETLSMLQKLMPDHWQDENIQTLVTDFYSEYYNPSQRLSLFQKRVFRESRKIGVSEGTTQPETSVNLAASQPPEMPAKLPKLIELLTSKTPLVYKAAVAHAVFPSLGTHLCDVRFVYTDNVEHEATLMNCLMAGTGSGKGCIDEPIQHIMADIERRDKENERREAEWKKDCQKKGANKDKMLRPEGLVIQIIDSDMTKPALVTRMDEAENHFVYVKLNELDLFEQLKGQTGKQHFQLMCLAFDPGATYGQTRVGTQSVTARPQCRFNWNACTTILKGRRFFNKVLTDGPISRINFCTIPETEIGAEQPIYGLYDAEFDETLKPYIDNLVSARGLIDCQQAFKLAKRLQEECAEFSRLSQNETYWNLSHRACVIAWLKACVLYVANGQKWERTFEDFIRWSLNYDLWCKMQFFGDAIERAANGEDSRIGKRGPTNLLQLLPDEFTLDDAKRVRQQQGLDIEKTMNMIRNWVNRNYIIQYSEFSFKKSYHL
jgi:hypothetical protein